MSFGKPQDEVANAVLCLQYVSEHSSRKRNQLLTSHNWGVFCFHGVGGD